MTGVATRRLMTLIAFGILWCLTASAQAAVTANYRVPLNLAVYIPCAAGGAGEVVVLSGNLHTSFTYTTSARGGLHVGYHFQPQGITGLGQTTGDKYQGTGVTRDQFNATVGVEETFVNNFRIIGAGPGNNYLIHEVFHVTFDANGVERVYMDRFSVDCR